MTSWFYRPIFGDEGALDCYTVGFYDPNGVWHPESDYDSSDEAAERVHWLNGGESLDNLRRHNEDHEERISELEDRLQKLEGIRF